MEAKKKADAARNKLLGIHKSRPLSPHEYDFRGRRVSPNIQPKKIETSHALPGPRKEEPVKVSDKPRISTYIPGKYSARPSPKDDPPKVSVKELNGFGASLSPADAYK